MNDKNDIKDLRFGLTNSMFEGYKEVEAVFNYNGRTYKHSIFVKEGKNVNYIDEARKQFKKDFELGKVLEFEVVKDKSTNHHLWAITLTSVSIVGAVALAALILVGIFTWKLLNNNNPTPTETNYVVAFESNGGDHVDAMKVKAGATISEPTITKVNYTFGGWYETSDFSGNKFNFATAINKDYTFYAKWTGGPAPDFYTLTINAGEDAKFPNGATSIPLKVTPDSNILENLSIITKPIYEGSTLYQTFNTFTYEDGSSIGQDDKVTSDGITVKGTYRNKTLNECSWEEINEISQSGDAESFFGPLIETNENGDVIARHSIEKTVLVNNQPHQVRIIGYNQDFDGMGNSIGITFEFANLISDENGNSLATQWNDTNDTFEQTSTANHNYLDSSLRMALVGEHEQDGHILWAQKDDEVWSTEDRSVLDMLPDELVSVLKTPSKIINVNSGDGWSEQTVEDKLFLLSPEEIGDDDEAESYTYYEDSQLSFEVKAKKQVNNDDTYLETPTIYYDSGSGQVYQENVTNFAGFNDSTDLLKGGFSWLRSPYIENNINAWYVHDDGTPDTYSAVYQNAFAVAPAFCI